jgi:hypothetical protein
MHHFFLITSVFVKVVLSNSCGGLQSAHGARAVSGLNDTIPAACQYAVCVPLSLWEDRNNNRLQCEELAFNFGAALHYPKDDNLTFWDARQQAFRPACRVEPISTTNVSSILTTLVNHGCRFAVNCGGHSRHEDDSNSVGGVTVDLQKMSTVTLRGNNTSAYLGGGATSHQVLTTLEPFQLAFVLGRTGSVGVGGFTLGGGTSTLSPR